MRNKKLKKRRHYFKKRQLKAGKNTKKPSDIELISDIDFGYFWDFDVFLPPVIVWL